MSLFLVYILLSLNVHTSEKIKLKTKQNKKLKREKFLSSLK